ncbi:MAG: hypothetical protein SWQ30_02890 [Thermodesulfobacteriota bacterium]|nr:hypothetical protein [Thermodesulfobacteriota bacterium]
MASKDTILIGCGPQAKYALENLRLTDMHVRRVFDPIGRKVGERIGQFGIEPFSSFRSVIDTDKDRINALICLSDTRLKEEIFHRIRNDVCFINAIHPGSHIAHGVDLGTSLIINAGAIIQPDAAIGHGCMIHAGVIVEHDGKIAAFVNLAPGVTLAGGVTIGQRTTVFSGAIVAPNVSIGKDVIIGAGSLVKDDIPDGSTAYGTPARVVSSSK